MHADDGAAAGVVEVLEGRVPLQRDGRRTRHADFLVHAAGGRIAQKGPAHSNRSSHFHKQKRLPYLTGKTRYNVVLPIIGIHRTSLLLLIVTAFQIDLYSHCSFVFTMRRCCSRMKYARSFSFFCKNKTTFASSFNINLLS